MHFIYFCHHIVLDKKFSLKKINSRLVVYLLMSLFSFTDMHSVCVTAIIKSNA